MKTGIVVLLWCSCVTAACECYSQDSSTHRTVFPSGIAAQGAYGYLATRDDHVSEEKYSGSVWGFGLHWSRFHETYGFRIGLTYEQASHVTNYNVSAEVTQGAFTLINLYPAGKEELFGNDLFTYIGPSAEAFVYYRKQNIAQNPEASPDIYQSGAWLFSLGARGEMTLLFGEGFQLESALQASLLSLGGGTGNESNNSTPIALLTPFAALRGSFEIGLRYYLLESVSLAAGYRLEVTRISSWNYILTSSDNAYLSLEWHL